MSGKGHGRQATEAAAVGTGGGAVADVALNGGKAIQIVGDAMLGESSTSTNTATTPSDGGRWVEVLPLEIVATFVLIVALMGAYVKLVKE